uniref:Dihydrolipoyl dehydrogenase n=1 Tax=Tanacetum cinerariifolium TaxID=118510 RepID=A0A6L2N988_TANCI|nr:dihydrolipoyl dehydrogenase [Tanacetum cinerariifolium]
MSSSSSDENKKMNSMIGDDDEIKATREKLMLDFHKDVEASFGDKLRSVTCWGSLQMRRVVDDKACRCRQLVTSRVGLSPILGNPGSQITGSTGNIGGRSGVERSMRSEGGLSVPCLTSRLNLNTNSGFGNLSVHGSKKLMTADGAAMVFLSSILSIMYMNICVERSMRSGGGLSVPCLTSRLNLNTNSGFGNLSVRGSKKLMAGMLQQGYSILMQQEIMALGIQVQPETLAVAVASEEERALEVVAVARLLNFFVEALCKVRGEIDVEFRDEENAADPYKELGRLQLTLSQRRSLVHRTGSKASSCANVITFACDLSCYWRWSLRLKKAQEKDKIRSKPDKKGSVDASQIATGRAPFTKGLGLENVPHVYCIGDANGKLMLAYAASAHGISGIKTWKIDFLVDDSCSNRDGGHMSFVLTGSYANFIVEAEPLSLEKMFFEEDKDKQAQVLEVLLDRLNVLHNSDAVIKTERGKGKVCYWFLGGVIDQMKYEDDCQTILGTWSFPVFTVDKLIHEFFKQVLFLFREYEAFRKAMFQSNLFMTVSISFSKRWISAHGEFESRSNNWDDVFVKEDKLMTYRLIALGICKEDGVAATRTTKSIIALIMPKYVRCGLPLHGERLDYTSMKQLKDMVERLPLGSYDIESISYASELDQNGHDADVNGDCHWSLRLLLQRLQLQLLLITLRLNGLNNLSQACA